MALIETVGAANANTYATQAELEAYLATRLPTMTLAAASNSVKEAALRMAARLLDASFDWTGTAVDETQALCWPRSGMLTRNGYSIPTTTIPQALKDAQCEFAAQLYAADRVGDNAVAKQGITSVQAGSVQVSFREVSESDPDSVDMLLRRLGSDLQWASNTVPDAVRQLLVASWWRQHTIKRPVEFGAM